jgi:hypothetical protein
MCRKIYPPVLCSISQEDYKMADSESVYDVAIRRILRYHPTVWIRI